MLATARSAMNASQLWVLAGAAPREACRLLECDVTEDVSISVCEVYSLFLLGAMSDFEKRFIDDLVAVRGLQRIDYVVLNAGILRYPNVSMSCVQCNV